MIRQCLPKIRIMWGTHRRTAISKLGTTGNTISVNANYRYYNIIYKVTNSRGYKAEKRMKLLVTGRTA